MIKLLGGIIGFGQIQISERLVLGTQTVDKRMLIFDSMLITVVRVIWEHRNQKYVVIKLIIQSMIIN